VFQRGTSSAERLSRWRYFDGAACRSDRDALYQKRCATKSNRGNYSALVMFQDQLAFHAAWLMRLYLLKPSGSGTPLRQMARQLDRSLSAGCDSRQI